MSRPDGAVRAAHERIRYLLEPSARGLDPDPRAGYLDVLGESQADGDGMAQGLMRHPAFARVYEGVWRPTFTRVFGGLGPGQEEELRIVRLMLALSSGDGVLDVACGTGATVRALARTVGETGIVVGLDASAPMLARATRSLDEPDHDNVALVRGDATRLPFRAGSFDAVCCTAALYLIEDPLKALDEMTRVLTPGGRIAVMTTVRRQAAVRPLVPVVRAVSGLRLFEREEITDALGERGFVDVHQRIAGVFQYVGGRLDR